MRTTSIQISFEDGNEDQIPVNSEIFPDRFGTGIF